VKPPEMVSRLDLVVLELAAAGIVFRRLPRGFLEICEFIELRGDGTEAVVGQHTPGRARGAWRGQVCVAHLACLLRYSFLPTVVFWPKKNTQKFSLRSDSV
jgi:hypothetical protein